MSEIITIGLVENIIVLAYGVIIVCALAGVLNWNNWVKILTMFAVLLTVETVLYLYLGYDLTKKLYPVHTHCLIILYLAEIFKVKLYYSAIYTMLAYMCCQIPAWIARLAYLIFPGNELVHFIIYIIIIIMSILFVFIRVGNSANEMLGRSKAADITFGIIPITYFVFDYVTTVWTDELYSGNYHIDSFMPILICITYIIYLSILSRDHVQRVEAVMESTIIDKEMGIVENEIENLNELQQMAKVYRSDIKKHFVNILEYIDSDDVGKAMEYINESVKAVDKITPYRFCENEMLNLILSHFAEIANQEKYDYSFKVENIEKLPLTNIELCAIVSNTLENAFNEMSNLVEEEKRVELIISKLNNMIIYSVSNSCDPELLLDGKRPESKKGEGHGFGTKSIISIAHSHGGLVDFKAENGIFETIVTIPI